MRKNLLKTGAALMAAVMVMSLPMTVKADEHGGLGSTDGYSLPTAEAVNGIADQAGYDYTIPSIGQRYNAQTGQYEEYEPVNMRVHMDKDTVVCDNDDWSIDLTGCELEIPGQAGYQAKSCYIYEYAIGDARWWWHLDGDGYENYEIIREDGNYSSTVYNFSATDDTGVYPDCKFIIYSVEPGAAGYVVMAPQGFKGNITLTFHGGKLENGEAVMDESTGLTFYLWGDAAAQQPAPTPVEQPAPVPEATVEQPAPAPEVTVEQPTPAPEVTVEQPLPSASDQGTRYVTKSGDNLAKIAQQVYGDRGLWKDIYEQNKELIKNPNVIYANMQLILP